MPEPARFPDDQPGQAGQAALADVVAEERALMQEFRKLLSESALQFDSQFAAMRAEIARVQDLLAEAIDELTYSFQGLQAGQAADAAALVGKAVTALQFQDMVSQLLAHVLRRVEALDGVVARLRILGDALDQDAAGADARAAIRSLHEEQGNIAAALRGIEPRTINNPVGQKAMTRGDIELF